MVQSVSGIDGESVEFKNEFMGLGVYLSRGCGEV
jgi:hypothetical protein